MSCQNIHNQILISSLVIPCYHKYSHNQFTVRVSIWILSGGFMVLPQHGPQIFQGSSFDDHIVYWPLTLLWLTGEFLLWNRVARQGDRMHILGYTMTTVPSETAWSSPTVASSLETRLGDIYHCSIKLSLKYWYQKGRYYLKYIIYLIKKNFKNQL